MICLLFLGVSCTCEKRQDTSSSESETQASSPSPSSEFIEAENSSTVPDMRDDVIRVPFPLGRPLVYQGPQRPSFPNDTSRTTQGSNFQSDRRGAPHSDNRDEPESPSDPPPSDPPSSDPSPYENNNATTDFSNVSGSATERLSYAVSIDGQVGINLIQNLPNNNIEYFINMVVQGAVELAFKYGSETSHVLLEIEFLTASIFHSAEASTRAAAARSISSIEAELDIKIRILKALASAIDPDALASESRDSELEALRGLVQAIESLVLSEGFTEDRALESLLHEVFDSSLNSPSLTIALLELAVEAHQIGFSMLIALLRLPDNNEDIKLVATSSTVNMLSASKINNQQVREIFELLVQDVQNQSPNIRRDLVEAARYVGIEGLYFLRTYFSREENINVTEVMARSIIHLLTVNPMESTSLNDETKLALISLLSDVFRGAVALSLFNAILEFPDNSTQVKIELIYSLGEAIETLAITREEGRSILRQLVQDENRETSILASEIAEQGGVNLNIACRTVVTTGFR